MIYIIVCRQYSFYCIDTRDSVIQIAENSLKKNYSMGFR